MERIERVEKTGRTISFRPIDVEREVIGLLGVLKSEPMG
jgi:hypothetical protein